MNKKKKWIKRQQEILDAARAAGRGLTAEEQSAFDELQRKLDAEPDEPERSQNKPDERQREPDERQRGAAPAVPGGTGTLPPSEGDAQRAVAEERQFIRTNGEVVPILWRCAGRPAWLPRSISAAERLWILCALPRLSIWCSMARRLWRVRAMTARMIFAARRVTRC